MLQSTCKLCNFNAMRPIALQSFAVLQSNCDPVLLCPAACGVRVARVLGDRVLTPDPNSGAIGDVFLQFLLSRCFGCNPEVIALNLKLIHNPRGCARIAKSQRNLSRIVPASPWFWADILPRSSWGGLKSGCNLGQSWTNLQHLAAIHLNCVWIALFFQSIHSPKD